MISFQMAPHVYEVEGKVPNTTHFKVHHTMCSELMALVDRISNLLPEIEAARPRCSTGIQALRTLNKVIEKAKSLLQYCSESSKLYLAMTGDAMLSRCTKSKNLLEQSLHQIQDMVPVFLAAEISLIIDDLSAATFILDPYEEEAGKVVRELIQKGIPTSDSMETSEIKALQLALSRLHIASPMAILLEKRSIKKLLDKVSEADSTKKKILTYFLYLFKKYGNLVIPDQTESASACCQGSFASRNSGNGFVNNQPAEVEPRIRYRQYEVENNILRRPVPPEEFRCPISSRLMYDPVEIASGQSYERVWIQKWFDEGHDTCPKTNMKLTHKSLTPNVSMKDLISRWCTQNGIVLTDPSAAPEPLQSWETSLTSIASFGSSMNDLLLQMDFSNISLGFIDASFSSDSSRTKIANGLSSAQTDDGSDRIQSCTNISETDLEFLSNLGELSWEARCKVVEEVKNHLKCNDKAYHSLSSQNFVEPLVTFLRDARESNDVNAQRDGFQLLLTFVSKNRNEIPYLCEDAFGLLASFLESEVAEEVYAVMEILSVYPYCRSKIMASGALKSILRDLNSQIRGLQEHAIKILSNLSSNHDICSQMSSLECIPKLVSLLTVIDEALVAKCLLIMKNLCNTEEARASVAETSGCIACIAEVLERGNSEEQEHAVDILLSLCSQRIEYCQLVMEEGIIPPLVTISVNGSDRGRVNALELLRQLRDIRSEPELPAFEVDAGRGLSDHANERKSSKGSGFFGRKIAIFSKNSGKKR